MINILPHADAVKNEFVVTDIENRPNGDLLIIDTAWREGEAIEHIKHDTWDDYWSWLYVKAKKDKRFRAIYAHNGGGWDWLSLSEYLLNGGKGKYKSLSAICAGSKMVMMKVTIKSRFSVSFCDSLQLLRSSLDKLGESYFGKGKTINPYETHEDLYNNDRTLFMEYLERDTELLLMVLEKTAELLFDNIAKIDKLGMTIASTAMKVFKTIGFPNPITIPEDKDVKDFLRLGYCGGRVEVFNYGHYDNVSVYDINSLYPSIMLKYKVPTTDRGFWTEYYHDNEVGVYEIEFNQNDKSIPALFTQGGKGVYCGKGVYFSPEIDLFNSEHMGTINIVRGYVFIDREILFREYVTKLYDLRLRYPDTPISLLCKFLLNSLYGKFGQNSWREKLVCVESFEELYDLISGDGCLIKPIDEDKNVYAMQAETDCTFEHVGIAGIITSGARAALYRGLIGVAPGTLLYCDTDSVHTTSSLSDDLVSESIGDYKREFTGEAVYAGKKLYGLRSRDGIEKIRAKGVSVNGRNGCRLSFADIVRLTQGEEIKCTFQSPATPKEVFKGKAPCVFTDKTRTLRMVS